MCKSRFLVKGPVTAGKICVTHASSVDARTAVVLDAWLLPLAQGPGSAPTTYFFWKMNKKPILWPPQPTTLLFHPRQLTGPWVLEGFMLAVKDVFLLFIYTCINFHVSNHFPYTTV